MRQKQILFLILLLLISGLVACGGDDDELQEPEPTATVVATGDNDGSTPSGGNEGGGALVPTNTPPPRPTIPLIAAENIDWPPQLVDSRPLPGQETVLDGAITLRFDQPMDKASVEAAFEVMTIAREGEDGERVKGVFDWPRNDTVVFIPEATLERERRYRVRVIDSAAGLNGRTLAGIVQLEVETVGYLDVSQTIPADDSEGVVTDKGITVMFNRPVVPLVSNSEQSNLPQPLQLEPAVAGEGEWISTSIYRFIPNEPLTAGIRYVATVSAVFEDVNGAVLPNDYQWSFVTAPPQVVSTEWERIGENVSPTEPFTVTFNTAMDGTSLSGGLTLAPFVPVTIALDETGKVATVTPQRQLALGTRYQLFVDRSVRTAGGQVTLGADYQTNFMTLPLPRVVATYPEADVVAPPYQNGITVNFSGPMDWETVKEQFQISPEPETVRYNYQNGGEYFSANFRLARDTRYVVTIPGTVSDPYGNTLGSAYSWSFTTPGLQPLVSFNLPPRMSNLSNSQPTQVDLIHRNVSAVTVSLYNLGLPLGLLQEPYRTSEYEPFGEPIWQTELAPATAYNQAGVTNLSLGEGRALPLGVYFVQADSPQVVEANARYWQNMKNLLIVADTNLVVKENFGRVHVWATDIETGAPVAGRQLSLYDHEGVPQGTAVTDANGLAQFEYNQTESYMQGVLVVSGVPGQAGFGISGTDYEWHELVSPWQMGIDASTGQEPAVYAYLYTDRPIYRPGDTVQFRGIVRRPQDRRYEVIAGQTFELVIESQMYGFGREDSNIRQEFDVVVDEHGIFTGEYVIPDEAPLAQYNMYLQNVAGGSDSSYYFTVAEYRAPEFLVTVIPAQTDALPDETVEVLIETSYFFGGPARDLEVQWVVSRETHYLPFPGPYHYNDDNDLFYFWSGRYGGFQDESILSGQGKTDENGHLFVTLPAELFEESGTQKITIEATAADLTGFPVSSRASVIYHPATTYVGISPVDYVATAGQESVVKVRTADWEGLAVAGQDVEVVYSKREWEYVETVNDFGQLVEQWQPVDTEVGRGQVTTNEQGEGEVMFVAPEGGTYRLQARVTDGRGRVHTSSSFIWATDEFMVGWRDGGEQKQMDIVADKDMYAVGDVARLLVQSPFEGPTHAWLLVDRGGVLEQRVISLASNSELVDVPILADYAPNAYVTIVTTKGVDESNQYSDIRMGIVELEVEREQLGLDVIIEPQGDTFQPGDDVVYEITVTDYLGRPVEADLSLSLVDLAVLTLKEDSALPMLDAFYSPLPYRSMVGASLFISGEGRELNIPEEELGMGGGGGGGGVAATAVALARSGENEGNTRQDFRDTAYWNGQVRTDGLGRAQVTVPLPDNLTTWRLTARASTAVGTLVGETTNDIISTLPLLIRPVTPRFMTVGDEMLLGAVVNNNSDSEQTVAVSIEATGLAIDGNLSQVVVVGPNDSALVRWPVRVADVKQVSLIFRAQSPEYQDATRPSFGVGPNNNIPVYRFSAEDMVGTAGIVPELGRRVEAVLLPPNVDRGEGAIELTVSPSLAAVIVETLDYLDLEPYDARCAHRAADLLLPNVATYQVLRELGIADAGLEGRLITAVNESIEVIRAVQYPDGGWSWCQYGDTDPYLTAYVLSSLAEAELAGFAVPAPTIDGARRFVTRASDISSIEQVSDASREVFYLYALALAGVDVSGQIEQVVAENRFLLTHGAKGQLIVAAQALGSNGAEIELLQSDLNSQAVVSANGVYWDDDDGYWGLGNDISGSALALRALVLTDADNGLLPNAARWLVAARTVDHWPTAQETAWSIQALTAWLAASGDLDANFEYLVNVNADSVLSGQFDGETIFSSETVSVPVSVLAADEINFVDFQHGDGAGRLYYSLYLNSFVDADSVEAVSRGVSVERRYYAADCEAAEERCEPLSSVEAGTDVRVELTIIVEQDLLYAIIEDPLPAGGEAIDPNLDTNPAQAGGEIQPLGIDYRYGYWGWWYFNQIEYRDEKVVFSATYLPAGTYQYSYTLRTPLPGRYQVRPTVAYQEFAPEVFGRSDGLVFEIEVGE
ncbi:MAG TPA: Ig-like domain-containing protein [Anaerolineae bacterium]|nr:Ig-like domain-containing protein [Anaerolineae bacterium]